MPRQDVQPALSAGLLSTVLHPARGTIFPQPMLELADGRCVRMDEVYPAGWQIIFSAQAGEEFFQAAKKHHLPSVQVAQLGTAQLKETEGVLSDWYAKHAVIAAVVRPDHYIYGVYSHAMELADALEALHLA